MPVQLDRALAAASLSEAERRTVRRFARQRLALDLSEEAALAEGQNPFAYSVHVYDPEWLRRRREIESFFIGEVDRDKLVLAGSALE